MKQVRVKVIFAAVLAAALFSIPAFGAAPALAAAPAFGAVPDIEVVTRHIERGSGAEKFELDMPQAVLKNASELPELAAAIDAFDRDAVEHVISRLAGYRERFRDEIDPAGIHYELSELEVDRADERMVSLRAIFRLWGVGAVNEYDALTMTLDCSTLEELTPDGLIADKGAFIEATARAIAEDAGIEPELLRGRFDEDSIGTVMGDEPEQLAVSVTENGARVTYSLMRGHVSFVDVPLETRLAYDLFYVAVELPGALEYAPRSCVEREFGPPSSVIRAQATRRELSKYDDGGFDTLIWPAAGGRPEMRLTCGDRVIGMSFALSRSRDDFGAIAAGMRELSAKYGTEPFIDIEPEGGLRHEAFQLITSTSFLDETEEGVVLSVTIPGAVMEDFAYNPTLAASIPRRPPLLSIGGNISREREGEWTKRETKIGGRIALTYTRDGSVVQYIAEGDKVSFYRYKSREKLASWYAGFGAGMTREDAVEWLGEPLRESEGVLVWRGIDEETFSQIDDGPVLILRFKDGAVTEVEYMEELEEKIDSAELDALYIL